MRTYECMLLINNDDVRVGWRDAKATANGLFEKHGAKIHSARHWDERQLAYPVDHKNRATYMLMYCDLAPQAIGEVRRDLDINETVLRYLITSAEAVPAKEVELSEAEGAADFTLPEPPPDDLPEPEPEPLPESRPSAPRSDRSEESPEKTEERREEETKSAAPDQPDEPAERAKADEPAADEPETQDGAEPTEAAEPAEASEAAAKKEEE